MKLMKVFFYRIRVRITPSSSLCATAAFPFLTIGAILSAVELSLETKINKVYIFPRFNARKVNCSCVYSETSSLWAEFVNKNRSIGVRLVAEEVKSIKF